MTPIGRLLLEPQPPCPDCGDEPCPDHAPQPGDEELGRALLKVWGDQIAAHCVDPKTLLRGSGEAVTGTTEALAALVRDEIDHAVMTQTEVAELAGITPKHLSMFLRGRNGMSLDAVDRVLAVCGRRLILATSAAEQAEVELVRGRRKMRRPAAVAAQPNLIARDPTVAATQMHAMADPDGWFFYPDNEEDAAWFAEHEQARPVHPASVRAAAGQHVLCGLDPCGECPRTEAQTG